MNAYCVSCLTLNLAVLLLCYWAFYWWII